MTRTTRVLTCLLLAVVLCSGLAACSTPAAAADRGVTTKSVVMTTRAVVVTTLHYPTSPLAVCRWRNGSHHDKWNGPQCVAFAGWWNGLVRARIAAYLHALLLRYLAALQPPYAANWDRVAQCESGGNWSNHDTGGNGHYGGLQFAPSTWTGHGGGQFAWRADYATRAQQITVAERVRQADGGSLREWQCGAHWYG